MGKLYQSAFKEKNLGDSFLPSSAKIGHHEHTEQMIRSGAGADYGHFSAEQMANLNLNDSSNHANNLQEIVPMKLNFSNEALGDESNNFEQQMMHNDQSFAGTAILQDFPSLKDLETSNLLTNKFMGERAARFAL